MSASHREYVRSYFEQHFSTLTEFDQKAPILLQQLESEIEVLSDRVSLNAPNDIAHYCNQTTNHRTVLLTLRERMQQLHQRCATIESQHQQLAVHWQPTLTKLKVLQQNITRQQCAEDMEEIGSYILAALALNDLNLASEYFSQLSQLVASSVAVGSDSSSATAASATGACNEVAILSKFYDEIFTVNKRNFEDALQRIHWPFITSAKAKSLDTLFQHSADALANFELCFLRLSQITLPPILANQMTPNESSKPVALQFVKDWEPIPLPIALMLLCFKKRFYFNFYGNRRTNQLEKPEWYLSQVMSYIADHQGFLSTVVQNCVNQLHGNYDSLNEFIRGLMILVIEKLQSDLSSSKFTDELFCHLIDELLRFDSELRVLYRYGGSANGALRVFHYLISDECFDRWLRIERTCAIDKLDIIVNSQGAWNTLTEESKYPECSDWFLSMIQAITERARVLPSLSHQAQFLALVDDLLMNFHLRLTQIFTSLTHTKASHQQHIQESMVKICGVANALYHVKDTLEQWTDDELFYSLWIKEDLRKVCQSTSRQSLDSSLNEVDVKSTWLPDAVTSRVHLDIDYSTLEIGQAAYESVFGVSVQLYIRQCQRILSLHVIGQLTENIRSVSREYRSSQGNHWVNLHSIPSANDQALSVSATLYPLLLTLRDELHQLQQCLMPALFQIVWRSAARFIDSLLYHKLVLVNKFNLGGGRQLQFDIQQSLIPLFRAFTAKPQTYFRQLLEACQLLSLPDGSLRLLMDVLHRGLYGLDLHGSSTKFVEDPIATLRDLGIVYLTPEETFKILHQRLSPQ